MKMLAANAQTSNQQDKSPSLSVQSVLDSLRSNIVLCDAVNYKIFYLNPAALETFRTMASSLPVAPDKLVGQSIDIFHKDAQRVRQLLSNPANFPHNAMIEIGGEQLKLNVNCISIDGQIPAISLQWEKKTKEIELADSCEKSLSTAIDSLRTNVAERCSSVSSAMSVSGEQAQAVSATVEELSSTAEQVAMEIAAASKMTDSASQEALTSKEQVSSLAQAANEIGEVVTIINNIASKTNLLALNATIEAARAGEAGRSFAVVAQEVKQLATQTTEATKRIGTKIVDIQNSSTSSAQSITGIAQTVETLQQVITTIASVAEEQNAATREVANNMATLSKQTKVLQDDTTEMDKSIKEINEIGTKVLEDTRFLINRFRN